MARIHDIENKFDEGAPDNMLGAAFISFNTEQERMDFERRFSLKGLFYSLTGECGESEETLTLSLPEGVFNLYSAAAPEPRDLIWEN